MDKQIEEMRNDLSNAWHRDIIIGDKFKDVAEKLTKLGYRKIPEGAAVLTREEYDELKSLAKEEAFVVFMGEPIIRASKIDEICKEITEGENG